MAAELQKIASFQIDHTRLQRGLYLSREDGDVRTWDLRMRRPNVEPVMTNAAIHSIEHLIATFLRSGERADGILYFGPMGCRTGCYLLTRGLSDAEVGAALRDAFARLAAYEGEVPGASESECGNWREHDLEGAKDEAKRYLPVLEAWTPAKASYSAGA